MQEINWIHDRRCIRKLLKRLSPDTQPADLDDLTQEACCIYCDHIESGEERGRALWRACRAVLVRDENGNPVYSLTRIPSVVLRWESSPDPTRSPSGAGNYSRAAAAGRPMHEVAALYFPRLTAEQYDTWLEERCIMLPDAFCLLSDRSSH